MALIGYYMRMIAAGRANPTQGLEPWGKAVIPKQSGEALGGLGRYGLRFLQAEALLQPPLVDSGGAHG